MHFTNLRKETCSIISRVNDAFLDKRLEEAVKQGSIGSEQWYRLPEKWFALTSFNNPYKTIHSELLLLRQHSAELLKIILGSTLVFYGVGTADTESVIVEEMLKSSNRCEVAAIDVSKTYLERFFLMLRNLLLEHSGKEIFCLGFHDLFENMQPKDLVASNSRFKQKCHICLGNTIGNFEQNEIFGIFKKLSKKGDKLVLGIHIASDMQKILKAYENPLMNDLLFASVKKHFSDKKPQDIEWKINGLQVEGWIENTRLLKSEKYTIKKIKALGEKHGFKTRAQFNDGNCAIAVLERE